MSASVSVSAAAAPAGLGSGSHGLVVIIAAGGTRSIQGCSIQSSLIAVVVIC